MRALRSRALKPIVYDDFSVPDGWPAGKWFRHRMPDYDMWDPAAVISCPIFQVERFPT